MPDPAEEELLRLTQRLLDCIDDADWPTYEELSDPTLTAFEPEGLGHRVDGLEFHRFYFNLGGVKGSHRVSLCDPHVRIVGDVAVVTYIRRSQRLTPERVPVSIANEETRIWRRQDGRWRQIHFHRSPPRT